MPAVRLKDKSKLGPTKPSSKSPASPTEIKVVGYVDQHGDKWLRVRLRGKWAFGRRTDLLSERTGFFKELERQDVAILKSTLQTTLISKAQNAAFEKRAYLVDRLGWHEDRYVLPGARLPGLSRVLG